MDKRNFVSFPVADTGQMKQQVLYWLRRFGTCCFLDSGGPAGEGSRFECLAGAGELARVSAAAGSAFLTLRLFSDKNPDWLFGHFSFALKAETESVDDRLPAGAAFPDLFFFVPETVIILLPGELRIGRKDGHESIFNEITAARAPTEELAAGTAEPPGVRPRMTRAEYLDTVRALQGHIVRGDCYEINYCQEFFATTRNLDPFLLFGRLREISPAPFSAFYRTDDRLLLCASPERYLRRQGSRVISQPIKGTAPRDPGDADRDAALRRGLAASAKDRAENVMVADLVRNDLSRFCREGSVRVEELFGIYSFAQVHQMVTTISGEPVPGLDWTEMIRASFPMGSMTGAPKHRVLELIGQYEASRRGLFSGALGYVDPQRDFDFNVVIRSLLYDRNNGYLGWFAGSAITAASVPEEEYRECLVKVQALEQIIKNPAG